MKKYLWSFILLFLFPTIVSAAEEFKIKCDQTKLNINDEVICRISVNTDLSYNKISFNLNLPEGLIIKDVRSNYTKLWKIENKDNLITATIKTDETKSGLQEFGILLLKSSTSGEKIITLDNINILNTNDEKAKNFESVNTTLKVISDNNNLKEIKINDQPITNFKNNITSYEVEIPLSGKIKIEATPENEFSTIVGNGEYTFDNKNNSLILPITVKSEDGNCRTFIIKFIHKDIVLNKIDKTLSSIVLKNNKGNNILFNFNPNTLTYYLDVAQTTTSIEIIPTLNNPDTSFVKGYGKQVISISSGDNLVLIKVVDKEGQTTTYILNIIKPISNKSANGYIKNLKIDNYKLDFSKKVKKYTLEVKKNTHKLNIKPILENENASYIIKGNDDLKEGSIIKIIVTAENGFKTTYQITIKYQNFNYSKVVIIGFLIGILFFIILKVRKVIFKKKKIKEIKPEIVKEKIVTPEQKKENKNPEVKKNKSPKKDLKAPIKKKDKLAKTKQKTEPKVYKKVSNTKKRKPNKKKKPKTNYKKK